jgi:UDP-N-acetyl-D-glucosamine dehydrogenase
MVKLLENTFRSVNIALVNEMAMLCDSFGVDVWEVIDAAATKPFGFMPFYPGPGLGGHCIPVDPQYLTWKARAEGLEPRFIELAGQINAQKPAFVANKIIELLSDRGKPLKAARVLALGVAYKKNVDDIRESPALDVMTLLLARGADVRYADPYVSKVKVSDRELSAVDPDADEVAAADVVILLTDHSSFDIKTIAANAKLVVDTRNAFKGIKSPTIFRV